MAKLSFSVTQAGLEVPVLIGLDHQATSNLVAAGQAVPPPIFVRGLLDTGSSLTAVAPWIFAKLGLTSTGKASTHTAAGQVTVDLYEASLAILPSWQHSQPNLTLPSIWVSELAAVLPDADVLIGLNVLLEYQMIVDGPGRTFSLQA
jgi:hypothetical protein